MGRKKQNLNLGKLSTPASPGLRAFRLGNSGKPGSRLQLSEDGWTLIELMIVVALIGIIVPATMYIFLKVQQAYASDEMHLQLKTAGEYAQLRMHERVLQNKHMFQNNSSGVSFLAIVGITASDPGTIAGSQLPLDQPTTQFSFSPNAGSTSADFGNCLLFCAYDFPQTMFIKNAVVTTTAPLTVFGPGTNTAYTPPIVISTTVNHSVGNGGGPATVILDVYRFYYYYLTSNPKALQGVSSYRLAEWESKQYVDIAQLNDLTDGTVQQGIVNWLTASPANFPGGPITLGFDPTQDDPSTAFFSLSGGAWNSMGATIFRANSMILSQVNSGILTTSFNYGVCGNNANWQSRPPAAVPLYGTASGNFPGGFETGIMGNGNGMSVLTRLLLVGQGAAPMVSWYDNTGITNVKDLW